MKVGKVFKTKAEAEAFVEGVEYVNDSAIEVLGIRRSIRMGWTVQMIDRDRVKDPPVDQFAGLDAMHRAMKQQGIEAHARAKADANEGRADA